MAAVVSGIEHTQWRTALTDRDFPQMLGWMCPILWPSGWTLSFTWRPSGHPHDMLVFGAPGAAFCSYSSAGVRFGWNQHDRGYVLDFRRWKDLCLYRCDGAAAVTRIGSANVTAADGAVGREVAIKVRARRIVVSVDGDALIDVADGTYRGAYIHMMRRMCPGVNPSSFHARFGSVTEHPNLESAPFSDLVLTKE